MEENKYSKGKIYKIISPSHPELVYYGSTVQPLCVRMAGHRRDAKVEEKDIKSKQILQYDDAQIILVEKFPCQSKEELIAKEAEYIRNNQCVNKVIPGRKGKQYREDNKDKIHAYVKQYYQENKNLLSLKNKNYRECNKEKLAEYDKQKYVKKKEEILKQKKELGLSKEFQQKRKAYLEANKEAIKKRQQEYYQRKKMEKLQNNK